MTFPLRKQLTSLNPWRIKLNFLKFQGNLIVEKIIFGSKVLLELSLMPSPKSEVSSAMEAWCREQFLCGLCYTVPTPLLYIQVQDVTGMFQAHHPLLGFNPPNRGSTLSPTSFLHNQPLSDYQDSKALLPTTTNYFLSSSQTFISVTVSLKRQLISWVPNIRW